MRRRTRGRGGKKKEKKNLFKLKKRLRGWLRFS